MRHDASGHKHVRFDRHAGHPVPVPRELSSVTPLSLPTARKVCGALVLVTDEQLRLCSAAQAPRQEGRMVGRQGGRDSLHDVFHQHRGLQKVVKPPKVKQLHRALTCVCGTQKPA